MNLVKKREVMTFGAQYVLVEFSFHTPPVYDDILFFEMQMARYKPVLAHFERYPYFHGSTEKAKEFLTTNKVVGHFTFMDLPFPNHSDKWVLKDLEERKKVQAWFEKLISIPSKGS